jgi:DNA-binding SARP family transcriptional activator/nucleoid-associated protein YgaU
MAWSVHVGVSSAGDRDRRGHTTGGGIPAVGPHETRDTAAQRTAPPLEGVWLADPTTPAPARTRAERAGALARGLASLVGLVALVAGLPVALAYGVGWPLPSSWHALVDWLNGPTRITPRGVLAAGACVLWLVWAAVVVTVLIQVAAVVRRIQVPRLPLAAPLQSVAAGLVGAVVIALTGSGARAAPTGSIAPSAPQRAGEASPAMAQPDAGEVTLIVAGQPYATTVHRGDTLSSLARDWLGDPDRWPEIYELNRGRHFPDVGGTLTDPDLIYPGWVLQMPADATLPPTTVPTPPPTSPSTPSTAPQPDPPTPTPTPATPTSPAASTPTEQTPPSPNHRPNYGIELPDGGWVAAPVAAAIAAAATLVWIQRRRRYRPRQPTAGRRDDTDLTPLPHPVAVLHHLRPEPDPDNDLDDVPAEAREALTVTRTALGTKGDHLLEPSDIPALGLGLVGPGANDAGRGVLAAVLSSGGPWASSQEATLITTRDDLTSLLGPDAADRYRLDRLQVFARLPDALDELEKQLLQRARIIAEQQDDDLSDQPERDRTDMLPPTVLLTQAPAEPLATRLAAILAVGSRLNITGIMLGAGGIGIPVWHVDTDGTTTPADRAADPVSSRLNMLDLAATTDILDLLQQARPIDSEVPEQPAPRQPSVTEPSPDATTAGDQPTRPAAPAAIASPAETPTTAPLRLTVLGPPIIQLAHAPGCNGLPIRRPAGKQILVYLAVRPSGASSDQMMAAIWPDVRPRHSRNRFHTTLHNLRKDLRTGSGIDPISYAEERYRLDPQHVDVDLWRLTTAVAQAAVAVDPDAHRQSLHEIVRLYTGDIADGESWLWLVPEREATRRDILDAYTHLADTETDPRAALGLIQNAIRIDPYSEDLHRRAMQLHASLGSADGVRRTLAAITERLAQLDVEVTSETRRAAADLLDQLEARRRHQP